MTHTWSSITPNPRHSAEYVRISGRIERCWDHRNAEIDYNLYLEKELDHDYLNELAAAAELLSAHLDAMWLIEFIPLHVRLGFEYTEGQD